MEVIQVGSRGVLFKMEMDTAVYLINSDKRIFLCDTHLGPQSMEKVKQYICSQGWENKELIIFNSHSDWDHVWGNCAFKDHMIIGHTSGIARMMEKGEYELEAIPKELRKGEVELFLPNVTFDCRLTFEEDDIEFIHAPGHTVCSSLCYDRRESVLYTGDLVENPMPFALYEGLEEFVRSLELIKSINAEVVVTAHSGIADGQLIDSNLHYIKSLMSGNDLSFADEGDQIMHDNNKKRVLILKHEKDIKEKFGKNFNYKTYKLDFWRFMHKEEEMFMKEYLNLVGTSYEELELGLKNYTASI